MTYYYNLRNRTVSPEINENGNPALQTADADRDAQATLQHVVVTYDQYRGRRVYVNGLWTEDLDEIEPAPLWNWSDNHRVVMGNDVSNDRPWQGSIRLVAIYKYALTDAQILQNFNAGVGKRILMRFDVSQWAGAGAYIEFVVSELDDYSYLFCTPSFHAPGVTNALVGKLRVMVNGQSPVTGQAFTNVDNVGSLQDALRELHGEGRLDDACALLRSYPGPVPDVPEIIIDMANWAASRGSLAQAIACLQRAVIGVALQPGRLAPAVALARRLHEAGEHEAALEQLERVLGYDYSHQPARQLRAVIEAAMASAELSSTRPARDDMDYEAERPSPAQQRYEILTELWRGGMGVLYRARDTRLERDVAIKVRARERGCPPSRKAHFGFSLRSRPSTRS